jgi:quercetin dioxygenase-like cupin family protein
MKYVFKTTNLKRYQFPTHINDIVVDRSEARNSEVFVVVLEPGKAPPLHKHDDTEQIFFIFEGKGTLTIGEEGRKFAVAPGDVVRIPPSTWHSIKADGGATLKYISVDCFGTLAREESTWDEHVVNMCKRYGWDYKEVTKHPWHP